MDSPAPRHVLDLAHEYALEFESRLRDRRVGWDATLEDLRAAIDSDLPDDGVAAHEVIRDLARAAEGGVVGTTSPRYFGFVIGGRTPASLAADWLTSVWDQNAGLYVAGPAAAVVAETAGRWLLELLGLPSDSSFGFVTGCQMASFTGLAAARNFVLASQGWDVEDRGLQGAPLVRVIVGAERHVTIDTSLRYLGLGRGNVVVVPADDQGVMQSDGLADALQQGSPAIVCVQAGNVNTGAFDAVGDISDIAHEHGSWVHVDGAFGLWAAASAELRHLTSGVEKADSWATDAHKWLNVPYDSGFVACARPTYHRAAMSVSASYLIQSDEVRDEMHWVPEFSRRARSFAVYAALRSLGRRGIEDVIESCCANARRFADRLNGKEGAQVVNDVVLNQVLVRFDAEDGNHDRRTDAVVTGVQEDGTCWLSASTWQGQRVMRISVTNWATTQEDVDRSADAILRIAAAT